MPAYMDHRNFTTRARSGHRVIHGIINCAPLDPRPLDSIPRFRNSHGGEHEVCGDIETEKHASSKVQDRPSDWLIVHRLPSWQLVLVHLDMQLLRNRRIEFGRRRNCHKHPDSGPAAPMVSYRHDRAAAGTTLPRLLKVSKKQVSRSYHLDDRGWRDPDVDEKQCSDVPCRRAVGYLVT
jgi:hypothetical protein